MVRGRMEGVGLMEAKVSTGLTGSVPNRGHEGGGEGREAKTRGGERGVETGRKAKR